ncbi:MAG TPA: hypothetical protein VGH28_07945 [Polyangiaceae bacterium]
MRAVLFAALLACGGAAEVAAPSKPPPPEVLAMQVGVHPGGSDDTFCQALELGLARSGVPIASGGVAPDVVISCHPFVTEDDSFIRMEVNGQRKMKFDVRVEVRAAQNDSLVDQFVADYKGYRGGPPDEDVVNKTVLGFAYSPRMAAYARAVAQSKSSGVVGTVVAQPTATATVEAPRADTRDDADWFAIDTVKCKIPARVEACDAVRRYLQRHPQGTHAQEANDILVAAQPALEKLQKDEVAWNKANHFECASRRTSDACVGVEAYEIQFPTGLHADVAHRLLKAAGVDK